MTFALPEVLTIAEFAFESVRKASVSDIGVTRAPYSREEQHTSDILADTARQFGAETSTDWAGNLYMRWPGKDRSRPAIYLGSHLDSVPNGGNFDGLAGIIAGLCCGVGLWQTKASLPVDLVVLGLRGEENAWYSSQHIGSRCALGLFDCGQFDRARRFDTGNTLRQDMTAAGYGPLNKPLVPILGPHNVLCFVELHIEQGPILEQASESVAVVTGIRGNCRAANIEIVGECNHSGTVSLALRKDAVLAAANIVSRLEELWRSYEASGRDIMITIGRFSTDPSTHGVTIIPGLVTFSLDVRSHDETLFEGFQKEFHRILAGAETAYGVNINPGKFTSAPPVTLSEPLRRSLRSAVLRAGLPYRELASGAGHDAADFAQAGIDSGMIFIRNANGSHNPHESMNMDDFLAGVRVLWQFVQSFGHSGQSALQN